MWVAAAAATIVIGIWTFAGRQYNGPLLEVDDAAPDFTLPNALGEEVSLSDFAGKQPVLLYFSMGPG